MKVIGIDPGLADTGYAVLSGRPAGTLRVQEAGLIRTDAGERLQDRLLQLHRGVSELFQQHRPDAVAVEDLYAHYDHPRTAILMGHARGVILLAAGAAGAHVQPFPPAVVKKSLTGNGAASKRQMQEMVANLLGLDRVPESDHVADALSLALCYHVRTAREVKL